MQRRHFREGRVVMAGLLLLWVPAMAHGQSDKPPPIGAPLIREGDFAVKLAKALELEATADEIEAESRLGEVGITPRNGWIADYPVTPDIIGELQKTVGDAAGSQKISLGREEALQRLNDATAEAGLAVSPYYQGNAPSQAGTGSAGYPDPTAINDYCYNSGPPVVTYYPPPPDYCYLYAWVPFPFWCYGFWYPGFFILHDFHRVIIVHERVVHVSNHFNDVRVHRVFRIDPVSRFRGRIFAGIGAPRSKSFLPTGVRGSERRIFHEQRERAGAGNGPPAVAQQ